MNNFCTIKSFQVQSKPFLNIIKPSNDPKQDDVLIPICNIATNTYIPQLPYKVLITMNDLEIPSRISNSSLPLIPNYFNHNVNMAHDVSNTTASLESGDFLPVKSEIERFNRIARIMGIN